MTLLERLRAQYEAARLAAQGITETAANDGEHGRALTETEGTDLARHVAECERLQPLIVAEVARLDRDREMREAFERGAAAQGTDEGGERQRADDAADRGERIGEGGSDGGERRERATTQDRDPGIYTRAARVATGRYRGERTHSFFHDLVYASEGDGDARERLATHNRALSNASQGAGLVPPVWLTTEFDYLARQGRVLSDIVRQSPLGDDPRPMTLPRQTAGTDSVLGSVTPENTHPSEANGINTATDTVTPIPYSGIQVVSRQMIDMDDPAIDSFVYSDLLAVLNTKIEALVVTTMTTAAGAAVTTYASDATNFTASAAEDGVTDAAFAVWNARKLPADIVAMRVSRWGKFNKFRDTSGRRLYPTDESQLVNASGRGSVTSPGSVGGLPVALTDGLGTSGYPETILVARSADTILFEGNLMRFRYEEVAGPESVKLGIWEYAACITRQNANSVRKLTISAA